MMMKRFDRDADRDSEMGDCEDGLVGARDGTHIVFANAATLANTIIKTREDECDGAPDSDRYRDNKENEKRVLLDAREKG